MLCQFLVYSKLIQLCICIYILFHILFHYKIREGNGTPLQYSCLENPMDAGAWCAAVHGVSKSWT